MRKLALALLFTSLLTACQDAIQPTAPSGPAKNSSEAPWIDVTRPGGPGNPESAVITATGTYSWSAMSNSNTYGQTSHKWFVSGDNGATWHKEYEIVFNGYALNYQSTFTRWIPPTANVPFLLKFEASVGGVTDSETIYVPVNFAPVPPSVHVQGPEDIWSPGNYTWEAMPSGGDGNYTYNWEISYDNYPGWQSFSTAKTASNPVEAHHGSFVLRVTVTSAGQQGSREHGVINHMVPPEW